MCFCHERESKNLETAIQNGGLKTAHRSARIYCFLSEILSQKKLYFHTQVVRTIERQEIFTWSIWLSQALWQVFFACLPLWSKYCMVDGGILDFLLANWYQQFKASIDHFPIFKLFFKNVFPQECLADISFWTSIISASQKNRQPKFDFVLRCQQKCLSPNRYLVLAKITLQTDKTLPDS